MNNTVNEKDLIKLVQEAVPLSGTISVTLLAGDASTRKYYRLKDGENSFIVVVSEPFSNDDPSILSNIAFSRLGAPVPSIIKTEPIKGIMVKDDLGSVHLQDIKDADRLSKLYDEVIDIMLSYQLNGLCLNEAKDLYPLTYSFTKEKFLSELNMTTEYYINAYKGKNLNPTKLSRLNNFYESLVEEMQKYKKLLQHRDYHSRNLMVKDNKVFVIDYQDARLGPFAYDIASLVIDPYIDLPIKIEQRMVKRYYDGIKEKLSLSYEEFQRCYDLCFIQRGVKILGTFAYQKLVKNNDRYLQYIAPSENKLKQVLLRYAEWNDILSGVLK